MRVIPLRNNALAPLCGGPRPLDGPPTLTELAGAAVVPTHQKVERYAKFNTNNRKFSNA